MTDLLDKTLQAALTSDTGLQLLRDLIISTAVGGRLVEQRSDEESAQQLIRRTVEKKVVEPRAKLAGRVRIGSRVSHPNGLLPPGWTWARLGEIAKTVSGNSINADEKQSMYMGGTGRPYIATKDLHVGFEGLDYENGVRIPDNALKFKVATKGTILICAEGGSAGRKCGLAEEDICFGNKIFASNLIAGISPRYMVYVYLSRAFRNSFDSAKTGIIGGVSLARFSDLFVPLPPSSEQERIVAELDELMDLCDQMSDARKTLTDVKNALSDTALRELIAIAPNGVRNSSAAEVRQLIEYIRIAESSPERLKGAVVQLAIQGALTSRRSTDTLPTAALIKVSRDALRGSARAPVEVLPENETQTFPKEWMASRLEQLLIEGPANGFSPPPAAQPTDVRSLTLSATTSGKFKPEHFKYIDEIVPLDSDLWLRDGDILVQRGNSIEHVGVSALYQGDDHRFIYPDLMMRIRVSSHVDRRFVVLAMSSPSSREYLRARASGTSGTMPKINQATLRGLPIPVPSIEEQGRIVDVVNSLHELIDRLHSRSQLLEVARATFLNTLMSADLRSRK